MTRKQTSAKVSKLAAKYLAMSDFALWDILDRGTRPQKDALFKAVRTLAASCLSQDEVKSGKPVVTTDADMAARLQASNKAMDSAYPDAAALRKRLERKP